MHYQRPGFLNNHYTPQQIKNPGTNAVTNALAINVWKSRDCQARHFLLSTVEVSQQRLLLSCTNANEMWEALSAQHMEHAEDNQHDLMTSFFDYSYKPGRSIKEHIADIKHIDHLLKDAGMPLSVPQVVTKIISILPTEYKPFKSSWRRVPKANQTIATLTTDLLQEERDLAKQGHKGSEQKEPESQSLALQARFSRNDKDSSQRGSSKRKRDTSQPTRDDYSHNRQHTTQRSHNGGRDSNNRSCGYCRKANHHENECRTKLRHERAKKEMAEIEKAKKKTKEDAAMAIDTHDKNALPEKQDFSLISTGPRFATRSTGDYFADSGATRHMTDQREALTNFTPISDESWTVNGIGSSCYSVKGYGDVDVWTHVDGKRKAMTIKNVIYVPGLGKNLLSIAAVTEMGWTVTFAGSQVQFTSRDNDVTMVGERVGKTLYLLAISPRNPSDQPSEGAFISSLSTSLATWHRRLAHVNPKTILRMASRKLVDGLELTNTSTPLHPCAACAYGKQRRSSFPTGRTRASRPGELIHSDLCGPMEKASPSGALYFALFIDDFSGYRFIYFLRQKSEAAQCFKELINIVRSETGNLVRKFRTDGGGEWTGNEFTKWLNKKGIVHQTSAPHTPEQDGVSERSIRTVTEGTRTCIHDAPQADDNVESDTRKLIAECHIPSSLWAEAASYTVYTLNRVLCKASPVTPYEAWHNRRPNVSELRPFGSIAYVHIPKVERRKLDQKSSRRIFVGYSNSSKAWRFWDPINRTVKESAHATFDEHHHLADAIEDISKDPQQNGFPESKNPSTNGSNEITDQLGAKDNDTQPIDAERPEPFANSNVDGDQPLRRSLRGRIPKKQWNAMATMLTDDQQDNQHCFEPDQYKDAIKCPEADKWRAAINDEYNSLMSNDTWSLVPCPPGRKPIGCRWTFTIKPAANGNPPRYKARLVAKGYSQRPGLDYTETYASVVTHDTIRLLMSIVAARNMEMAQLDVKTAFLYGNLTEDIYMDQPEGFTSPGRENEVCHLKKTIYGLKQASRVWGERFSSFLQQHGFTPSSADPCLFVRKRGNETTYIAIYVDDGIIASDNQSAIDELLTALGTEFEIRSSEPDRFVGMIIHRNRQQRKIYLLQPDYTAKIIKNFQMKSCHPRSTPADPSVHLVKPPAQGGQVTATKTFPYREAIGSLLYLALVTRPDISFAVGQAARFVENFDSTHCKAVRQIISYLQGTRNYGICFDGSNPSSIIGYTDADYAGCLDNRRSTTGNVFMLNGGPIAWCSRRQPCVATSTTEAEYIAASDTSKETVWIRRILPDLQQRHRGPITILCDNQSAIQLAKNPDQRQKTKHIDVRFHYIREQQERGEIDLKYVQTSSQLADIFTKPLPGPRFAYLRHSLGIVSVPVYN